MTLKTRNIEVSFELSSGDFSEGLGNAVVLSGHRCEATISCNLGIMNTLSLRIFGMKESDMHRLSTLGMKILQDRRNQITVSAISGESGAVQVFQGTIIDAAVDYRGMPDVGLEIYASAGFYQKVKAVAVNSYKGDLDVANFIKTLSQSMGFAFMNNGVTARLSNPYFAGSAVDQIASCATAAGINYDISNGVVNIWPSGGRKDDFLLLVSPSTGLVGYPVFDKTGVTIQTEFNPDIQLGRRLELQSSVPQACGIWNAIVVRHELSSMDPGGPWFTYCNLAGDGLYVKR